MTTKAFSLGGIALEAICEVAKIGQQQVDGGKGREQVSIDDAVLCLSGSAGDVAAFRGKTRRSAAIRAAAWALIVAHEVDDQGEGEEPKPCETCLHHPAEFGGLCKRCDATDAGDAIELPGVHSMVDEPGEAVSHVG